jgi:hypothetical protein
MKVNLEDAAFDMRMAYEDLKLLLPQETRHKTIKKRFEEYKT